MEIGTSPQELIQLADNLWYRFESELVRNYKGGCDTEESALEKWNALKKNAKKFRKVVKKIHQTPDKGFISEIEDEGNLTVLAHYEDEKSYTTETAELILDGEGAYAFKFCELECIMPLYIEHNFPSKRYSATT